MKPFYYLCDFPERKNAGKNFVTECPKCGKNIFIFPIRQELFIASPVVATSKESSKTSGKKDRAIIRHLPEQPVINLWVQIILPTISTRKENRETAMENHIRSTYDSRRLQKLPPEAFSKIKPLTDDPETKDQDQLAARRYLTDQGISLKTAIEARIGCLTHRCYGKDEDNKSTGTMYHCVAYVNFLNGQPVNVKYRSCDPSTIKATDEGETTGREKLPDIPNSGARIHQPHLAHLTTSTASIL